METCINLYFSFTAKCIVSWTYATVVVFIAENQEHHFDGMWSFGKFRSCEMFRTVRSMSSTIINFGMLALEKAIQNTYIICGSWKYYRHVDRHKSKDGHNQSISTCVCSMKDLNLLSGEKGSTESYEGPWNGRYSGKNFWENPPISTLDKDVKVMRIRMKM